MKANILGNNIWMYLGIAYTMLAIPYVVYSQMMTLSLLLVWLSYVVWMVARNKTGYSLVIIALALIIPKMVRETDVYIIGLRWPQVFLGLGIVAITLLENSYHKRNPVRHVPLICGLFLLLALVYCSNPTLRYFRGIVDAVIFIHCMFFISSQEKMKFENIFQGASLIFIITAVYAILHYFFNIGPYSALTDRSYEESLGYVFIKREGGLLCNSLIMTAICVLYHSLIIIRVLKEHKMAYIMEILCISVSVLTISRTAIFIIVLQFLILILYNRKDRLGMTIPIAAVLCIFFFVFLKDSGAVLDMASRMENVGSEHRESGYSTTLNIFLDYPFGVGKQGISRYMHEYNTGGIEEDLVTLDNFYLTQIAAYGIFVFISFIFYLLYFFKLPWMLKIKDSKNALLLVFYTWCLLGLSYDVESFEPVTVFCFGLTGLLFNCFKNEEKSLYEYSISNHH